MFGFLRLKWYYRRFINSYGRIVRSLTQLLKKRNFVWTKDNMKTMHEECDYHYTHVNDAQF